MQNRSLKILFLTMLSLFDGYIQTSSVPTNTFSLNDDTFVELWVSPVYSSTPNDFAEIELIHKGNLPEGPQYSLASDIKNIFSASKTVTLNIVVIFENSVPNITISLLDSNNQNLGSWTYQDTEHKGSTVIGINMAFQSDTNDYTVKPTQIVQVNNSWETNVEFTIAAPIAPNEYSRVLELIRVVYKQNPKKKNPSTEYSRVLELIRVVYKQNPKKKNPSTITEQIGTNLISLKSLIGDINVTLFNGFPTGLSSMPPFSFNFILEQGGYYNYSFIANTASGITPVSGEIQTALDNTTSADFNWTGILRTIDVDNFYMALLAFDENNNFINSLQGLSSVQVTSMALVAYDSSGNLLSGMPLIFPAQNYTGNKIGISGPVKFDIPESNAIAVTVQNTKINNISINNYPFLIKITVNKKKKNPKKPTGISYQKLSGLTLTELQTTIPDKLYSASVRSKLLKPHVLPGWSLGQGWNLNLVQISSNKGYAFVQNPWSGYSTSEAITNINVSAIESTIICSTIKPKFKWEQKYESCYGSCNMVLLAFDKNNNYMSNILDQQNPPVNFGLFMYDSNGNLLPAFPIPFSTNNYVGGYKLISTQNPAQFILGGLGSNGANLTYPFNLTINWYYQGYI
jgi:hypothetical protein